MNTRTVAKWCEGIIMAIIVIFTSVLPQSSSAQEDPRESLTPAYYLKKVFNIAREIGHVDTLQAILMQESRGLKHAIGNPSAPVHLRSYGLMQVQLVAARSILARQPELLDLYFPNRELRTVSNRELINLLLTDDDANIRIASYHFKLYYDMSNGNWYRAVAAYNVGIGGVQRISNPAKFPYVQAVAKWKNSTIRPFNLLNGLSLTEENR